MDEYDAARMLSRRFSKFESKCVTKHIILHILWKCNSAEEMLALVSWSDELIIDLIKEIKHVLGLTSKPESVSPYTLPSNNPLLNTFTPSSRVPIQDVPGSPGMFGTNSSAVVSHAHQQSNLLPLMQNISLIDRPYGQQSVKLEEDGRMNMEKLYEVDVPRPILSSSKRIFLTFPAHSTFTEEDVSNYFKTFGDVEEVTIPSRPKRDFGFITFASAGTVKILLSPGTLSSHYIGTDRECVRVKPFKGKSKVVERNRSTQEKSEPPRVYQPPHTETDPQLQGVTGALSTGLIKQEHDDPKLPEAEELSDLGFK